MKHEVMTEIYAFQQYHLGNLGWICRVATLLHIKGKYKEAVYEDHGSIFYGKRSHGQLK